MLNPLNKLLYLKTEREKKKKEMQKLNTLSEAGICLVVIECFASAGDVWCTVRHCLLTH